MSSLSQWAMDSVNMGLFDIRESIFHAKQNNDPEIDIYRLLIWEIAGHCNTIQINCLALKQMIDEVDRIKNAEDGMDNHG
jgi:hypothetical protein